MKFWIVWCYALDFETNNIFYFQNTVPTVYLFSIIYSFHIGKSFLTAGKKINKDVNVKEPPNIKFTIDWLENKLEV